MRRIATARLRPLMLAGALFVASTPAVAQGPTCQGAVRLNVVIDGLRSREGELVIELYRNDPSGFLNMNGRIERRRQKADAATACLVAPAAGDYAVIVYHDENNDQLFNRSLIGLPSEGFGLSNNVRPRLGAPSLRSVLFKAGEGETTVRITMQYLSGRRG